MKTRVIQFVSDDVHPGKMSAVFLGRKGPVTGPKGIMTFWEFEVIQDEETLVVSGVTSQSFNHDPRCKAMRWVKIIDPTFTDEELEWDDERAIGNIVTVEVEYRSSEKGLVSSVKDVFPCQEKAQDT